MNKYLPKKWKKMRLGDVLTFQRGYDLSRKKMCNGKIPVAGSNGIIGYHNTKTTHGPGVTIGRSGSIGKPTFYKNDFWAHNTTLYVKNFYGNDEKFIFYLIQALDLSKFNSGSAVPTLNRNHIHELKVIIPSLIEEQKKIVEILSTWDQAIEKIERLVSAKEKQFKWLLKKFIADQKNNPKWKKEKLDQIVQIKKGQQLNRITLNKIGNYPVQNGGIEPSGYTDKWNTREGTITISEGGNSCGFVKFNEVKFWSGGHCYALIDVGDEIGKKFLFYYLKSNEQKIMRLRVGSGLPNIQKTDIEGFQIVYPDLVKQEQISNTLDCRKKEITTLKRLSSKYQKQKSGLMQQLLTGKRRV